MARRCGTAPDLAESDVFADPGLVLRAGGVAALAVEDYLDFGDAGIGWPEDRVDVVFFNAVPWL